MFCSQRAFFLKETVTDFIFLGSKITADGDCSHEIKNSLWKKSYGKPRQYIKKQRHCFADKGLSSQSYGFSRSHVWMWELDHKDSWAPKNWCFELWWWRRLFRVPWTARRSNQSILKEISPEYSLKGLMRKLKPQYFGCLMQRAQKRPWCWERLKAGGEEDRGRDGWMAPPRQWTWVWASSRRLWRTGKPGMLQFMGPQRVRHNWVTEQQQPRAYI